MPKGVQQIVKIAPKTFQDHIFDILERLAKSPNSGNMKPESLSIPILGLALQSVRGGLRLGSLHVLEFRSGSLRPPSGIGGFN